jgi:hypothetical protein
MKELFIQRIERKVLEHLHRKESLSTKENEKFVLRFILLIKR